MMKKILPIIAVGILVLSGFGVSANLKKNYHVNQNIVNDTYDMVIITPNKFSGALQPLIEHKNNYGVKTFLKTTEDIYKEYKGSDDAEKIKYFIKDALETYTISYVLLVGGRQGQRFNWYVPCRYSNVDDGYLHRQFLSDLYFADIYDAKGDFSSWDSNGNGLYAEWYENDPSSTDIMDMKPDVALGRLPCRSASEVESIVEKIINYEKNTYGKSWFKQALFVGGDTNPDVGETFPYEGETACNYTKQFLDDFNINTLFVSDGSLSSSNDFISSFNEGNGFVLFHGHGLTDGLFTFNSNSEQIQVFDTNSISQLNNKDMYPIVIVGCCATTEFDVGILNFLKVFQNLKRYHHFFSFKYECVSDIISWNMMKNPDKGSIAHIGCSSTAWGSTGDANQDGIPDSVQDGYTSGLCTEFFRIYGEENTSVLGDVYNQALSSIIDNHSTINDRIQCKCVQEFQLIGDPSLKIGGYPSTR
jgi:hypothetical protein